MSMLPFKNSVLPLPLANLAIHMLARGRLRVEGAKSSVDTSVVRRSQRCMLPFKNSVLPLPLANLTMRVEAPEDAKR